MRNMMYDGKRGKNFWVKRAIFIPIAFIAGIFIFGSIVMLLWNAILPTVLGIHLITFWQAVGILVLSKILFSGFHRGFGRHRFHAHDKDIREKWMQFSTEERERMRAEFMNKWRGRPEPQAKPE
jgi:Ca2+/H+ antiporter, TMEM165/GDT1 family